MFIVADLVSLKFLKLPLDYAIFFMVRLNSKEHKHVLLINFKMPTIVGILKPKSRINALEARWSWSTL